MLSFGLSSACYLFTQITRPLIKKWREEGKLILMYIDDGFGCVDHFEKALELGYKVKSDLSKSGFISKAENSVWQPVQVLVFKRYY